MSLCGHTALITGAGQGIGRACALIFASSGADLVLLDKNPRTLTTVVAEVAKMGRQVVDLTELERLKDMGEKIRNLGLIDILVNNAGFDRPGTTAKIEKKGLMRFSASMSPCR